MKHSLMWVYFLMIGSLITGLTSSPYMAMCSLICSAFLVSWMLGVSKISWAFFVITILFIGGMMVMFMYMTSLMSSAKVSWGKLSLLAGALLALTLVSAKFFFSSLTPSKLWASGAMELSSLSLLAYLILFLLVSLLVVCSLAQKHMGPMKSHLKK